jgi:hypothetical protein
VLGTTAPADWPVWLGNADIPSEGTTTTLTDVAGGDDPTRFFAVIEKDPLPVTVFEEDFDGPEISAPNLPAEWTTDANTPPDTDTTLWELGIPSPTVVSGPPAANSGANCVGTNLAANYGLSSDIWLRTPPIPLSTATGATLTFQHWVDIDDFPPTGIANDRGTVRVLDATDLQTVLETLGADITGLSPTEWVEFSANFTAASLGKSVVLEFVFVSDDDDDNGDAVSSGWYVDDVVVTGTP